MHRLFAIACAVGAFMAGAANAAQVDTIDASSGQPGTFFVPVVGQELDSPYYRFAGGDWGWTHNGLTAGFTSAILNISAFDVDEAPCGFLTCEEDVISALDVATNTWIELGILTGDDDSFSFTEFDIFNAAGGALQDDIVNGLQVQMEIDRLDGNWAVSLSKSVITTDGADPGNPDPPAIPLPAAAWLLLAGAGSLAAMKRRQRRS